MSRLKLKLLGSSTLFIHGLKIYYNVRPITRYLGLGSKVSSARMSRTVKRKSVILFIPVGLGILLPAVHTWKITLLKRSRKYS